MTPNRIGTGEPLPAPGHHPGAGPESPVPAPRTPTPFPLFCSGGESEIRRWIIENDWLEAIVALPDQLFYNTGIYTYVWIVTNRKAKERRGKVQLINGVYFFRKMRKSLNNKWNEISPEQIEELTRIYGNFQDGETWSPAVETNGEPLVVSKVFDNTDFGFRQITVERPLRLNIQASSERIDALG